MHVGHDQRSRAAPSFAAEQPQKKQEKVNDVEVTGARASRRGEQEMCVCVGGGGGSQFDGGGDIIVWAWEGAVRQRVTADTQRHEHPCG
jgi:hypothetical protein